ncbi:MAG TPA: TraR/DksA family transcriptional regulator [Candidatus Krumholzibacteria bacterium]|nr:TraR/DksA family transcriptional regulator [Candidatus Krumholzibacteria bacterium]HPD71990.1 TraR/DksA family transcriptional regulator [Candidatus Krumholzibacteria bacterium]HRY41077.1 TraR/DksA family transcriptional regulator [Candidatus Krumholzibacteria bacterium]
MDKRNLAKFREILLNERARLLKDVQRNEKAIRHADGESESGAGRAHSNHLADQGSDEAEYETKLLLSATQMEYLREIDEALQRIEDGTYGICEMTGEPIGLDRLRALPTARLSVKAQEKLESSQGW